MLRNFLEQHDYPQPQSENERFKTIVTAYDTCVDFLRDPTRFPNPEINALTTLMWNLVGNGDITPIPDKWNLPTMTFMLFTENVHQAPVLIIPKNFVEQVQEDPLYELGIISYTASQCKDFYCAQYVNKPIDDIEARSRAYEVETLLTIERMAAQEDINIDFSLTQLRNLVMYPKGLQSLPNTLWYPTPLYKGPPNSNIN